MGNWSAQLFGFESAPVTVDDSANGLLAVIDSATKETHGGKFWDFEGKELPW